MNTYQGENMPAPKPEPVRDAATVARERAMLSGIPHHVLQTSTETWVAGHAAYNNLWPDLVPLLTFDSRGEITNG